MIDVFPRWTYFPRSERPPAWVYEFAALVGLHKNEIDSRVHRMASDTVLKLLANELVSFGFAIEATKARADKLRRPVLFGQQGVEQVAYEIDAFHDALGIVLEIEAGRGRHGGAFFRDLIRTSLIVGADYLVIGMLLQYRYRSAGKEITGADYDWAFDELDAIYGSGRLNLPFQGVLLFGY